MYDWGAIASGLTAISSRQEFASYFAKREKAATKALDKTIEVFKSNNNKASYNIAGRQPDYRGYYILI